MTSAQKHYTVRRKTAEESYSKNPAKIFLGVLELLPWGLGIERVPFFLAFVVCAHNASAHNYSYLRPYQARFISISGLC